MEIFWFVFTTILTFVFLMHKVIDALSLFAIYDMLTFAFAAVLIILFALVLNGLLYALGGLLLQQWMVS